ncbi:unnamed protein product [Adineta steineri]|uniref:Uncharacterized protein n=1 Tax=Adineta steineri TaxID=433720 RepID=A0A815MLZ8_9BILA|nr:unnamed protein product [Adineta steineri]CAF1422425.1 unnamed protein product [Adineta steineri]
MAIPTPQHAHPYKLLVVGDTDVGKTAFSSVISNLYPGESTIEFSIGYNVRKKAISLNGERIELEIYDSTSAICRDDIIKYFETYVDGIFIIYNATNRESFENAKNWLDEINNHGGKHVMKLIIGNKCDLAGQKAVSFDEADEYGIESNISIFEVSARDLTNVELAFKHMISKIRSNLTPINNNQPDQYEVKIALDLNRIFNVDLNGLFEIFEFSNGVNQHVNDQGVHDGKENESEPYSREEHAIVTHTQIMGDGDVERQILLIQQQIIEEKAKQSNVSSLPEITNQIQKDS